MIKGLARFFNQSKPSLQSKSTLVVRCCLEHLLIASRISLSTSEKSWITKRYESQTKLLPSLLAINHELTVYSSMIGYFLCCLGNNLSHPCIDCIFIRSLITTKIIQIKSFRPQLNDNNVVLRFCSFSHNQTTSWRNEQTSPRWTLNGKPELLAM